MPHLTPPLERDKIWPFLGRLNVFRPFGRMVQAPATKKKKVFLAQKTPENSKILTENRSDTVKGAHKPNGPDLWDRGSIPLWGRWFTVGLPLGGLQCIVSDPLHVGYWKVAMMKL